jgi:hypothetical protein
MRWGVALRRIAAIPHAAPFPEHGAIEIITKKK